MTTIEKIISPDRKTYSVECDNGLFDIDGCKFTIFNYNDKYFKIPGCPASPDVLMWNDFSGKEIEKAWIGFKKFAKKFANESSPIHINPSKNLYKYCNGFIALYCEDCIVVFKNNNKIKAADLSIAGFAMDYELVVPLSEDHISYYNESTDTLIYRW